MSEPAYDLSDLTPEQLTVLSSQASKLAKEREETKVNEAVKKINAIADEAGLSVRVFTGKEGKKTLPVKYRDPANESNIWRGGYGCAPGWLKKYLNEGRKLEEFLV